MSEIKWTLFSEEQPVSFIVYITDFEKVWVSDLRIQSYSPDRAWAEIPIPEVPVKKRELHRCVFLDFKCHELEDKRLYLDIYEYESKILHECVLINFCPFCGFNPEKEPNGN